LIKAGVVVVNISGDRKPEEVPLVAFRGSQAIAQAVDHFAELDLRHITFVGRVVRSAPTLKWLAGKFIELAGHSGIKANFFELGATKGSIEDRSFRASPAQRCSFEGFLKTLSLPHGIWCEDDFIARFVCDRAEAKKLSIPGDIAVLGFQDYRVARMNRPTITTIPQPGQIIGRKALEWIHESLQEGKQCEGVIAVPCPPVEARDSTMGKQGNTRRYRQAMATIREHACTGLTVEDLVGSVPVSQPTFSMHFAKIYGRTPGAEIRAVRLERAKHYLRSTTFSIERIAGLCGFEQSGKFSTFFRRETAMTPSAYRHSIIDED
jgi:LacI family transcriptional regulator